MATSDLAALPNTYYGNSALQHAGFMGDYARNEKKLAPGGVDLSILMCVSTWEHTWLRDFGVAGKRDFLEEWWKCIDWEVVEGNAGLQKKRSKEM